MRESRDYNIIALKGIACMGVFVGHLAGIVKYSSEINISENIYFYLRYSPILFNEQFWLQIFFLISGFLVAKSNINKIRMVIVKIIRRFIRLSLPIFFSYLIIGGIEKVIGFWNGKTVNIFRNQWLQKEYITKIEISDVILGPINVLLRGKCDLNSPYWVLREMFLASVIIYLMVYLHNLLIKRKLFSIYFWIIDIGIVVFFFQKSIIIFSCLIGMNIYFWETWRDINYKKNIVLIRVVMCLSIILWIFTENTIILLVFFSTIIFQRKKSREL